jgi:hypothetical protein
MKNAMRISILSAILLASSLVFNYSCKKKTNEVDTETQSVVDNSICEQEFMQIQPTTNNMAIKTKGTGAQRLAGVTGGCDSLVYLGGDNTYSNTANPPRYQFIYNTCSAANVDGVVRTGTIQVTFIGKPKLVGSKTIIKLLGYNVNGLIAYKCDSIVVTTLTDTLNPIKSFNVKVINGSCVGNGWEIRYACDKTIAVNTNSTLVLSDDVTTVNGTANGTNRNGKNFTVTTNNITKAASCKWISSGTVDVTPEGLSTRTVDFGNGTCDADATYTVNGQTIKFIMK